MGKKKKMGGDVVVGWGEERKKMKVGEKINFFIRLSDFLTYQKIEK